MIYPPGDDSKDHDSGGKLRMDHDENIFDVFADSTVVLLLVHFVLVKILLTEKNLSILADLFFLEDPCFLPRWRSRRFDLTRLLGGIRNEHDSITLKNNVIFNSDSC